MTVKQPEFLRRDLEENPFYKPVKIKPMKGRKKLFRYAANGLRVIYEINSEGKKAGVVLIGTRGDIYKKI